jgi:hypothetical protein
MKKTRYRIGLSPIQEKILKQVNSLNREQLNEIEEQLRARFSGLHPAWPLNEIDLALDDDDRHYYHPSVVAQSFRISEAAIDRYMHSYIGVHQGSEDFSEKRMSVDHEETPFTSGDGTNTPKRKWAGVLKSPLPLRLLSTRAMIFVIMAPTHFIRPGDAVGIAIWYELDKFRKEALLRYGINRGIVSPISEDAEVRLVNSSVNDAAPKPKVEAPMPVPNQFQLLLAPEKTPELDEIFDELLDNRYPVVPATPAPVVIPHPVMNDSALMESYFEAVKELRTRSETLRGLLDLLPQDEVERRVADYFRAGLDALDKGR